MNTPQHVNISYNSYSNKFTSINNNIASDESLTISAFGLLVKILSLPKSSNLSFSSLYTKSTSEKQKELLVEGFRQLVDMEYLCPGLGDSLDINKGPLGTSRYTPLVKFLTLNARYPGSTN